MHTIQTFLADGFQFELDRFRKDLDGVPESEFHTPKLGHTPAWHALHTVEWLRFFALQDHTPTYSVLGWEDAAWLPQFTGTPPVAEQASKAEILAELERVKGLLLENVRQLRDDQWDDLLLAPAAPDGKRQRLAALRMMLTHINYHRGQLLQGRKA